MNDTFKSLVKEAIAAKRRKYVKESDVVAVACRESGANPIFDSTEPLYNLNEACGITLLPAANIITAVTIASGEYQGKLAKFRCEPTYWRWAKYQKVDQVEQFLLSCSIGVGQKMMRYFVADLQHSEWLPSMQQFMGDVPLQLLNVAADLDMLLAGTKGNRALAFTRYNAGPTANQCSPAYKSYGLLVAQMALKYANGTDPC